MWDQVQRLFRQVSVYSLANVAQNAVGFLLIPLYTRTLSTREYGYLEILTTFSALSVFFLRLEFPNAFVKVYIQDCETEEEKATVLGMAIIALIVVGLVGVIAIWFSAPTLSLLLLNDKNHVNLVRLSGAVMFSQLLAVVPLAWLRSEEKSLTYGLVSLLQFLFILGLNLVLVRLWGVTGVLASNIVGGVVAFLVLLPSVVHHWRLRFSLWLFQALLAFGLPLVPGTVALWGMKASDRYFLRFLADYDEVGIYALGNRISSLVLIGLVMAISLAWNPFLFNVVKRPDAKKILARMLVYIVLLVTTCSLVVAMLSPDLIRWLSSADFWSAYKVVPWLMLAYVFHSMNYVLGCGTLVTGKTYYNSLILGISVAVNLVLNYLLIRSWGMTGAAISTLVTYVCWSALSYVVSQRLYPIRHQSWRIFKVLAGAVIFYWLSTLVPTESGTLGSVAAKSGLLLLYLPVLYAIRVLTPSELAQVKQVAATMLKTRLRDVGWR
jgi:O-antigen/teichoic acid export membrane protein